jgi:hypothetical protein
VRPARNAIEQRIDAVPAHAVCVALAARRILQQGPDEVDAWLDGDDVAFGEGKVAPQRAQRGTRIGGAAGEGAAGVAHAEPDEVSKAVGEEEGVGVALHQFGGLAAHHAHRDESGADVLRRPQVNVLPLAPWAAATHGVREHRGDEGVEVALEGVGSPAHDIGAGDIADVPADSGAGIDEDEVAGAKGARRGRYVEDCGVAAGPDDGAVAGPGRPCALELGLQLDLDRALGRAGLQKGG